MRQEHCLAAKDGKYTKLTTCQYENGYLNFWLEIRGIEQLAFKPTSLGKKLP